MSCRMPCCQHNQMRVDILQNTILMNLSKSSYDLTQEQYVLKLSFNRLDLVVQPGGNHDD